MDLGKKVAGLYEAMRRGQVCGDEETGASGFAAQDIGDHASFVMPYAEIDLQTLQYCLDKNIGKG